LPLRLFFLWVTYCFARYTNCLIALFNNRVKEGRSSSGHGMQSVHLPESSSQQRARHNHNDRATLKVHVVREMDMSYDGDHDHDGQMELGNIQVSIIRAIRPS
jgi:hypothetical protein